MTIRELIEKTIFCDYLEITIRKDGEGEWIYQYKVGEDATTSRFEEILIDGKWRSTEKCFKPNQALEFREVIGGGRYLPGRIIPKDPKKAPKEVLDLELNEFQAMTVFSKRNRWGIFATAYPKGWTAPEPERKQTEQLTLF